MKHDDFSKAQQQLWLDTIPDSTTNLRAECHIILFYE